MAKKKYSIKLLFGRETFESSGDTPYEALSKLKKPEKMLARGLVTISHNGVEKKMLMNPLQLRRMFYSSPTLMEVKAKQLFAIT